MKPSNKSSKISGERFSWITRMLHFSDSALPVGAYAHSFGLEGMCQMGVVYDKETLRTYLIRDVSASLTQVDLPLTAHAYNHALEGETQELYELDKLSYALRPSRQLRGAASSIGRQQLKLYQNTWGKSEDLIDLPHCQSPIIMAIIFANEKAPIEALLSSIAYQTYSALLQASLKLLPLGPSSTQELLHDSMVHIEAFFSIALETPVENLGSFNPTWDIAASRHEHAEARLFIS